MSSTNEGTITVSVHDNSDESNSQKDKDAEVKKKLKWLNIDYLLVGRTGIVAKPNVYLQAFVTSRQDMLCLFQSDLRMMSWRSRSTKDLRKEITEAMAACARVKQQLHLDASESNLALFDLCSGKGMLSILLAHEFPLATIHMIDNNPKMNLTHLQALPTVQYHLMNLFSQELEGLIQSEIKRGKAIVLCGIHLCGDLSRRALELWEFGQERILSTDDGGGQQRISLVLSPCCLVKEKRPKKRRYGTFGYYLGSQAKEENKDPYDLWCQLLHDSVPDHVESAVSSNIVNDDVDGSGRGNTEGYRTRQVETTMDRDFDMLSDKNAFIVVKTAPTITA